MEKYFSIQWVDNSVQMLDQRLLPAEERYLTFSDYRDVAQAIRDMVIRGAPAIGAAAGFGLALAAITSKAKSAADLIGDLSTAADILRTSRPTAVNLSWALNRILGKLRNYLGCGVDEIRQAVVDSAIEIADEDVIINQRIGQIGASLLPDNANVIHHCNTGALATVGYGTALGVIRWAHESGKNVHVYVDETRPRLQGARLTSWELMKLGIPHTILVDGASGHIMRTKRIDLCLVGCDRIAANGDVANKIGTYNLALVAYAHQVPFYSVGPLSTVDIYTKTGDNIPIEERSPDEVTHIDGQLIAPMGAQVTNPAFDITPARYITGIVTERGIARPPYSESLNNLAARGMK